MAKYDVTENRNVYIGGSDIPAVMNISPFKKRFDLLKEKAGIQLNDFEGNKYTEYGVTMEPKIREFVNSKQKKKFVEDRVIEGDCRYHSDGFNGECVLEIKTTSVIHDEVHGYKNYLVQLLFGMMMHDVKDGLLAVYERPEDWNEEFSEERLSVYKITIDEEKTLIGEIRASLEAFRADLNYVKENPFCSESELPSLYALTPVAEKVAALEVQLKSFKDLEKKYKDMKAELYKAMEERGIKSWELENGTKVTLVAAGEETEVDVFDSKTFEADHPRLWKKYQVKTKKKGRAGYVKITLPKTDEA